MKDSKQTATFAAGCFWGDRRLRLMRQTRFFLSRRARSESVARAALFLVCGKLKAEL